MEQKYILDNKKVKKFLITFAIIILGVFVTFKSLRYLAPFLVAYIIASIMEPLVKFIVGKTKIPRKIISAIILVGVIALLGSIFYMLIGIILHEVKGMMHTTPGFIKQIYKNIDMLTNGKNNFIVGLPDELTSLIKSGVDGLFSTLENWLNFLFTAIFNYAVSLPSALVFLIVTILSTYFISSERKEIKHRFKSKIPEELYSNFSGMKKGIFSSLFKLITAYLIIMTITFTEVLVGLSIINVRYALILAFLICLVDILPVLGTGTVLIPWIIYEFTTGNNKMGFSILILYGVIFIVRQMIEPKIIGNQIGVHPLISLLSIYGGLKLLGPEGLFLGPIIMIIIKNTYAILYKDKSIQEIFFKLKSEDDIEKCKEIFKNN